MTETQAQLKALETRMAPEGIPLWAIARSVRTGLAVGIPETQLARVLGVSVPTLHDLLTKTAPAEQGV